MNPTTFVLDGDYSQKLEIGHWVIEHHTGHVHFSGKIAGQNLFQKAGPVTIMESVSGGTVLLSAALSLPFGSLPLGHFDVSKAGSHEIKAKLDGGNYFTGTLTVS